MTTKNIDHVMTICYAADMTTDQQVPTCNYGTPFCYDSFDHSVCIVDVMDQDEAERYLENTGSISPR